MAVLVLDDQLADPDVSGQLPAGRNRSEAMFELLIDHDVDAHLYDGRTADGVTEIRDPRAAAAELVSRLVNIYGNDSSPEFDVILDLKWFDNEDYGRELLAAIMDNSWIRVRRIVVWSVITDRVVRRRFFDQFEVPPDQVLDRAATPEERVLTLIQK